MAAAVGGKAAAAALHLLTFNVAGIPFIHPGASRRMPAIAEEIKAGGFDVVALQEAWFERDARAVAGGAGLPHYARVSSPLDGGTGLSTLSRWPITLVKQIHFTGRPNALRPMTGEGIARKGALLARVATPRGELDVWNVHLIADYRKRGLRYYTMRLTQVFELAEAVAEHSRGRPFVLAGDLNAGLSDVEYRALTDLLGLEDACVRDGGDECLDEDENRRRIDHILYPASTKDLARGRLALSEPIPGTNVRFSDHDGVAADLDWGVLRLRLDLDARRRLEALARVEAAAGRMSAELASRRARLSWLPVAGWFIERRCSKQIAQLESVRARVAAARIRAAQGRP